MDTKQTGTEWTEPGQGATWADLENATVTTSGAGRFYMGNRTGQNGNPKLRARALEHVRGHRWTTVGTRGAVECEITERTNLRLTGAPLIADDLKRIATCEAKR